MAPSPAAPEQPRWKRAAPKKAAEKPAEKPPPKEEPKGFGVQGGNSTVVMHNL